MSKIGLFYGSDTGNTERIAELIAEKIGNDKIELVDLNRAEPDAMENYEKLIFGAPTWYDGELQSDWDSYFDNLDSIDFSNKTVAIFGLGDQYGYPDYFLDAMGIIYDKLIEKGAKVVGAWDCSDYDFTSSKAERDGKFVGLGIDEDNEDDKTEDRINEWIKIIEPDICT
ncbi:MAG: flavodoxin FldA [Ignavibacteriae bacterium]|nr:MAG: flavodoxin FldA [Ignavibacteriota bacterium]